MAKDKLYEGRIQGMYYAYDQIQKHGLEAFADELRYRQKFGVNILQDRKDIKAFQDSVIKRSMECILVFAVGVLHDEFGFGRQRCERFIERFNLKASCIADNYLTWDEQIAIIEQEIGLHVGFTK